MENIREIDSSVITDSVIKLCHDTNIILPEDISNKIENSIISESFEPARNILIQIKENYNLAKEIDMPICQDTGMLVVFAEIGQDVHIVGDLFEDSINKGVKKAYNDYYFRKSIVNDPINRVNTNDNTPAIVHTSIVKGSNIKLSIMPKGFGSENMSAIAMLNPSDGIKGVHKFVLETVAKAGAKPCPPIIIGIGIGGTFEKCALLSKLALLRDINIKNENEFYAKEEEHILNLVNSTGIGPQGFGGKTTALAVNIIAHPTHIAGLPVAINIGCHVTRHKSIII